MSDERDVSAWVDGWLAGEQAALDPEYPRLMTLLNRRRAGQSWHKHGTFRDHLTTVYRMLKTWGQDRDTCLCGLFHSVYSNEYVDLALFDPREGRDVLVGEVGGGTEQLIHRFCTIPRTAMVLDMLARDRIPAEGIELRRGDEVFRLTQREVAVFTVVTVADLVEQWYSWQEDTMSSYPHTGRLDAAPLWSVTLWPGPFRPGSSGLALASRLARHLPGLGIPVPPVFERCTRTLDARDESAAAALYWQVASLNVPLVDPAHTRNLLEAAIAHNPWVGEPYLQLAQVFLMQGNYEAAAERARQGLRLLSDWGVQWDKRVTWEGWIVWGRMLVQRAQDRAWPGVLRDFNNLGLVRPDAPMLQSVAA